MIIQKLLKSPAKPSLFYLSLGLLFASWYQFISTLTCLFGFIQSLAGTFYQVVGQAQTAFMTFF